MAYLFENCVLDTSRRELRRGATIVAIEPKVFDLLEFLIRTRERVASRDDLIYAVWEGRIVSESTLSSRINAARSAIGDDGNAQRLIRTLPRKGFRFVGEVRETHEPDLEAAALTAHEPPDGTVASVDSPSIAVLPFTNMSSDPEQDYFADGMSEEIITGLSRCGRLFVVARNSSFTYKGRSVDVCQVGRELGVSYLLEGSVRRDGNRLRITGQLIDAKSRAHLWADRFDGELNNVFELQDRVTECVVAAIEPKLQLAEIMRLQRKPVQAPRAYDLVLRAQQLEHDFTDESLAAAIRCLDQALAIDPSYAQAMALAAYCHAVRHFQGWVQRAEDQQKGVRLALDAVKHNNDDANVLWMAAFTIWTLDHDGPRARELFRQSLLINPNSAIASTLAGWVEAFSGDPEAGRRLIERARRLSPRDPNAWVMSTGMAIACIAEENFSDAINWAEKALLQNQRFAVALRVLAVGLAKMGRVHEAKQVVQDLLTIEPRLTISGLRTRVPFIVARIWKTYSEALRIAGLPE